MMVFFSLQKLTDLSNTLIAENPEVNAAAVTQDPVTEEAISSPLAMWELEIQNIELEKGEGGLGFSILDYQVRISYYFLAVLQHLSKKNRNKQKNCPLWDLHVSLYLRLFICHLNLT